MSAQVEEIAPDDAAAEPAKPTGTKKKAKSKPKPASAEKKEKIKKKKKGKGPGKYSQLVIDAIKTLDEKNGSSLFKIYNEAKKVSWFDQKNGRVYLRYSIRALLQNDTLVQVKGLGANGSFKLNTKKFSSSTKKSSAKPKKPAKPAKPAKKPAKKAGEKKGKKKSVSGLRKKALPPSKSRSKPETEEETSAAAPAKKPSKPKKAKQAKKTVKKA